MYLIPSESMALVKSDTMNHHLKKKKKPALFIALY